MKLSRIFLFIISGVGIVTLTVGITLSVQHWFYRQALKKKAPYISKLLGKNPRDMLYTIKLVRAIEALALDEAQSSKFISKWISMKKIRERHRELRKEKLKELQQLLRKKTSDEELTKTLSELKDLENDFHKEILSVREEMGKILTPTQQAKLILFEATFRRQMKDLLKHPPIRVHKQPPMRQKEVKR